LNDGHVHFGICGLTGLRFFEKDVEHLIRRFKLDKILLFPFDRDLYRMNRKVIRIGERNKHVVPLARVSPSDKKTNAQLRSWFASGLVGGIKIHPSMDRIPVTSPRYRQVLELVDDFGKVAVVHCGRWQKVSGYRFVLDAARKYPNAKLVAAHMGGNELDNTKGAIEGARNVRNVFLDTSNCRISLMIQLAVKQIGADRLVFGSDTPWGNVYSNLYTVTEADISHRDKQKILNGGCVFDR
jgi:hypothetical protein